MTPPFLTKERGNDFWCADGQAEGRGKLLRGKAWWDMEVWAASIGFERGWPPERGWGGGGRDRGGQSEAGGRWGGGECICRAESAAENPPKAQGQTNVQTCLQAPEEST